MYDKWGHPFVSGETISPRVCEVNDGSAAGIAEGTHENHFQLDQYISQNIANNDDPHDENGLQYNDFKKMFDSLHKLSSNSKAGKVWLREFFRRGINERISATMAKNTRNDSSTLPVVSCFPSIDTSKKSVNNCK